MFFSRSCGAAHFLALASATAAVVGLQFDDVKWAVSIAASMFGTAAALYIFRGNMRAQTELLARADVDELRRRLILQGQKPGELRGKDLPSDNHGGCGE